MGCLESTFPSRGREPLDSLYFKLRVKLRKVGGCSAVGDRRIVIYRFFFCLFVDIRVVKLNATVRKDWVVIAKFAVVLLMISNDVRVISSRAAVGETGSFILFSFFW